MKSKIAIACLIALAAPGVYAQTCTSPTHLDSLANISADTCSGNSGLDMGGTPISHQYVVYEFTWQDQDGDAPEPDLLTISGQDADGNVMNAVLSTSCDDAPMGGAAPGFDYNLDTAGLTDGQNYVVVVTIDPGVSVPAGGPICADYTLSTDTLPVELQSMSVE